MNIKRVLKIVFKSVIYVILFIVFIPILYTIGLIIDDKYFPKEQTPKMLEYKKLEDKCFAEITKSFIPLCDAYDKKDNELMIKLESEPIPDYVRLACADVYLDADGIDSAYVKYKGYLFGMFCDDG
jgi:hypothetical protein